MQNNQFLVNNEIHGRELNVRLDEIGWALFLIMVGSIWLFPNIGIPADAWLIGAGLILLGINFARFFYGIKMSGFTVFLGVVALVAGVSEIFNLRLPLVAALFIVLGVSLLIRAFFKR